MSIKSILEMVPAFNVCIPIELENRLLTYSITTCKTVRD